MDAVVAAVRCRPMTKWEIESDCANIVDVVPEYNQVVVSRERSFTLNHVYSDTATQQEIYDNLVDPIVKKVTTGYTACVMAYGQTGSGKTYTMGTKVKATTPGIVQKSLEKIFSSTGDFEIHVSFLEVYKEEVLDLLSPEKKKMHLVDFKPVGLTLTKTASMESALSEMEKGLKNRHVGATNANLHSSRSHAVFTIHFSKETEDGCCSSKLYLVDLAGSESVSEMSGDTRKEGVMINKGLLQLGNVMSALSSSDHVPYRNSALTTVLKDTLSPQNYVVLIACVSPLERDAPMTVNSLQFASRVRSIKGNPEAGLLIKQRIPVTTPFKLPLKRVNTTIATPGSHGKIKRPALRPLNNTFDSPRTPRVQQKKQEKFWSTSTPFLSSKPLFTDPTPIPKGAVGRPVTRRSSSEWDNLNISSSTTLDTNESQVKTQAEVNQTGIVQSSENESWLRTLIADVIREELKSHTFMAQTMVQEGPSPPKKARRSTVGKKESPSFFDDGNTTIMSSSPNEKNEMTNQEMNIPQLVRQSLRLSLKCPSPETDHPIDSLPKENKEKPMPKPKRVIEPVRRSSRLSAAPMPERQSTRLSAAPMPVRRSTRLSVAPKAEYVAERQLNVSTSQRQHLNVPKQTSKAARLSVRLSMLPKAAPENAQSQINNFVLEILQSGDIKKLQCLPTVGPKTAVIINNHRLLHGPIESFKDLSNVRGLSVNFVKRFLWANNIIEEDLDASL